MLSSRFIVLFFLLMYYQSFSQEEKNSFDQLIELSAQFPDSILKHQKIVNNSNIDNKEKLFIIINAKENRGFYKETDSLISYAFENFSFENDTSLYLKYLKVLSDQRKITDQFEEAVKIQHQMLEISKRHNDTVNQVLTHISMGELYRSTENFKLGLAYLKDGEELIDSYSGGNLSRARMQLLGRRAAIFLQDGIHLDSVEKISLAVIVLAKANKDLDQVAVSSNELGYLYSERKDKRAEKYLRNAVNIWNSLGYKIYEANGRLNLARYYLNSGNPKKGIEVLKKIEKTVEESDWKWEKGGFYEVLGELYAANEEFRKAYIFTKRSKDFFLEVNEKQYNKRLALLSTLLEVKKKEQEISDKEREIEKAKIRELEISKEKFRLYLILVGALFIVITFFVLIILINNQRKKLKIQRDITESTNKQLKEVVALKETLLKELNHRVKNNLTVLSGLLYFQEKKLESEEAKKALKDSIIRINTMSLIHESLYQREDMDKVDFQEYITNLLNYIKGLYQKDTEHLELEIDCTEFTPELATSIPLALILNECITNSFKYAFNSVKIPRIRISFSIPKKELIYSDNGPGVVENEKRENSIGLNLIQIFAKQINAQIRTEKKPDGYFTYIKLKEDSGK